MNMVKQKTQNLEDVQHWGKSIPNSGKILEVGSGGSPHPKSTILCDKYLAGKERSGAKLAKDRPFVLGNGEKLPFKDNVFDYSICIHVIEHADNPALFLDELMRVSKKGYIETPSILWEEMQPWREFHKWLIFAIDNTLIFKKKKDSDSTLHSLMQKLISSSYEVTLLRSAFKPVLNVSFEWDSKIEYLIEPENLSELLSRWTEEMIARIDALIKRGGRRAFFRHMLRFMLKRTQRKLNMFAQHWPKFLTGHMKHNSNLKEYLKRFGLKLYYRKYVRDLIIPFVRVPRGKTWVFIVGCYNSGTTLLDYILGCHEEISALPTEGAALTRLLARPEDLGWPRMWYKCVDRVRLDEKDTTPNVDRLKKEWGFWFDKEKSIFLEKSIANSARIRWLNQNFDQPYFIWIIRNGYCVAEGIR